MRTAVSQTTPCARRVVNVAWTDVQWQAPVIALAGQRGLRLPAGVSQLPLSPSCSKRFSKNMKHIAQTSGRASARGFTLIELLVVIAIIAILAGLILPAVTGVKKQAKVKLAKAEMNQIAAAIKDYEAAYDRYPVSKDAEGYASNAANPANPDFTFGGPSAVSVGGRVRDNSDVVEILLDMDFNDPQRANYQHRRNPKKTVFINAKSSVGNGPGVDANALFRDAWGNPYVITIDMNDDSKCHDAVYGKIGGKGLIPNGTRFELNAPVMIWSMGPDGQADPNIGPDQGVNKDNILGWTVN